MAARARETDGRAPVVRDRAYWFDIVFGRFVPAVFFSVFIIDKLLLVRESIAAVATGGRTQPPDYLYAINQVLGLVYFLTLVLLYVVRLPRKAGDARPHMIFTSLFGSFAILLVSLLPQVEPRSGWNGVSSILVAAGLVYTLWSLFYLRRSFSILPEARRLVTGGPYAVTRHPLYLGEAVAGIGLNLPTLSAPGALVIVFVLIAQYLRIRAEERVLERQFPEYADYRRRVPRYLPLPRPRS